MINNKKLREESWKKIKKKFYQYFKINNIEFTIYTKKQSEDYMERWFNEFAPTAVAKKNCFSNDLFNNYLWHLFSYEYLPCFEHEEAVKKYKAVNKGKCVILLDFEGMCFEVNNINDIDIEFINSNSDIYITDFDFNWCYVYTHESECCGLGPYFYQK